MEIKKVWFCHFSHSAIKEKKKEKEESLRYAIDKCDEIHIDMLISLYIP